MNFFAVKFGLDSGVSQSEIMQILKSNGADVIQTSAGLCVKSQSDLSALKSLFQKSEHAGVTWQPLDADTALLDDSLAADVKAFIKG